MPKALLSSPVAALAATPPTPPTCAAASPQIIDLGLWLARTKLECQRLSNSGGRYLASDRNASLIDREESLELTISTMVAETIQDAGVQIAVACSLSVLLDSEDWTRPDAQDYLREMMRAVVRLTLSALPPVAAAAGLDMTAMGWSNYLSDRDHYLGARQ